jgi:hypothetical protein
MDFKDILVGACAKKHFVLFLIILLCISLFMTFPCKAAVVWSDDFDDGNYNGWIEDSGAFSTEDKTLRTVPGDSLYGLYYPSYVTTGTWSFDMLVGSETEFSLMFSQQIEGQKLALTLSGISIVLRSYKNLFESMQLAAYMLPRSMTGWQHFDVTRDSDGRTCVYSNGTLVIDVADAIVITSELIRWISRGGAIDNIVVSNTIDIEPPPSVPFYMQIWFLEAVGAIALAVAVIIVFLGRRKH